MVWYYDLIWMVQTLKLKDGLFKYILLQETTSIYEIVK